MSSSGFLVRAEAVAIVERLDPIAKLRLVHQAMKSFRCKATSLRWT
jgi:hypothetical protein